MRAYATVAVAVLCSISSGQDNRFEIYPDSAGLATTLSDRAPLGANRGELLQEFPGDAFNGIGDVGNACRILRCNLVIQDEDGATPDVFSVIARRGANPGPDTTAAGLLVRLGPLTPPPAPPGPTSWVFTFAFANPVATPCTGSWYFGVELAANPQWSSDGLSVHAACYPPTGTVGDNPRATAPNLGWAIDHLGAAWPRGLLQVMHVAVRTVAPVLNMGGFDPSTTRVPTGTGWGAGGIYPDVSGAPRSDGISARVRASRHGNGFVLLFAAYRPGIPGGVGAPDFAGRFYLDPNLFLVGSRTIGAAGEAVLPLATPGTLPAILVGRPLFFQAVCIDALVTSVALTNSAHQLY